MLGMPTPAPTRGAGPSAIECRRARAMPAPSRLAAAARRSARLPPFLEWNWIARVDSCLAHSSVTGQGFREWRVMRRRRDVNRLAGAQDLNFDLVAAKDKCVAACICQAGR